MSNSEASHAGNLKNFDQLISVIKGYGDTYNPANPLLKIPALEAKSATAHNSITLMNSAFSEWKRLTAAEPPARGRTKLLWRTENSSPVYLGIEACWVIQTLSGLLGVVWPSVIRPL